MINDLSHYWSGDLSASNIGDIALANGVILGQQRVLRRLLTTPGEYVFHPTYGGGLPTFLGTAVDIGKVKAVIRGQVALEPIVAQTPAPVITITQLTTDNTAFSVSIQYTDATTTTPVTLSFNVSA